MRYLLGSIGVEAEKGYMRCNGSKDEHKCNPVKVNPPIRVGDERQASDSLYFRFKIFGFLRPSWMTVLKISLQFVCPPFSPG